MAFFQPMPMSSVGTASRILSASSCFHTFMVGKRLHHSSSSTDAATVSSGRLPLLVQLMVSRSRNISEDHAA